MKDPLIPFLLLKQSDRPRENDGNSFGAVFGAFIIAGLFAGDYTYSHVVELGWAAPMAYLAAAAAGIVGGAIGALAIYFIVVVAAVAIALIAVVLIGAILFGLAEYAFASHTFHSDAPYLVERIANVYDGDTFTIVHEGEFQRVRFRGIDTPEIREPECEREAELARAAKVFTVEQLRRAQRVSLVNIDPDQDRYGRWIATVYVDGVNLNELIVIEGFGRVWRGRRVSWC